MSSSSPAPHRFFVWWSAMRPKTLPAAVVPVGVGSALAWQAGLFHAGAATACLGFALLVQIGTNFANDYFDYMQGADTPERVGPRRAVASGWVRPGTMRSAAAVAFILAFLCGLTLVGFRGWELLPVGVLSILCGIAYTGGPYPLAYHGWGDLFVFVFFGLVAVNATYYVLTGTLTAVSVLASVPIGLLATNILLVNNYRDVETDARAGKRTLLVRWGRSFGIWQYGAANAFSFVIPPVLLSYGQGIGVLLPLSLLSFALRNQLRLRRARQPSELNALLGRTAAFLALYGFLLAAGIALP